MSEATAQVSDAQNLTRQRYRLISADSHVNEPPDIWTSRVAKKFVDRVPTIKHFDEGDAWVIPGIPEPILFGLAAAAGLPLEQQKAWTRWEDIRPGGYDPKARLVEMDLDGVDATVLYSTPRLGKGILTEPDPELSLAMVRAYNDWISEYASYAPDRLGALMMLPGTGVKDACEEFERAMQLPGARGANMQVYPSGQDKFVDEDTALFKLIEESGTPVSVHIGIDNIRPTAYKTKLPGDIRFYTAPQNMLELLWGGVFDRHPDLRVIFAEVDSGWVPFFKEQTDNRYHRLSTATKFGLNGPPSEYFDKHVFTSFVTDSFAIHNRQAVGVNNMLWSDDFPHLGGDFPNSWRTIDACFMGANIAERDAILAGNAAKLYHFG